MFQIPALIVMTIAATRMYRSLVEFSDLGGHEANTEPKMSFAAPISHNRGEETLRRSTEDYPLADVGQYIS